MRANIIMDPSFNFSLKILDLQKYLLKENEFVISKQLLRSATSIGANVHEASAASSKRDFANKMAIASKEARESYYRCPYCYRKNNSKQHYSEEIKD